MSQQSHQSLSTLGGLKTKSEHYNSHAGLSWIFHFVDIIYVGAIYSIGQLFEQCGTNHKVFFMAASYMGIMFTTRYQFDQYASTFTTHKGEQNLEFTRIVLMILYCMAIYSMVLNIAFEQNHAGISDSTGHFGECVRNQIYDNGFAASFMISRGAIVVMYGAKLNHEQYRNDPEYKQLLLRKLIPAIIASALMAIIFADVSPVIVFSMVAFVEFFSEYIGESILNIKHTLMPESEHLQERLGLFFMLVLGETMVGTLFVFYTTNVLKRTYGTCMSAFVLVTAIGMQFFERAQNDVESESNFYGDKYVESEDPTRLSTYVDPATVSAIHNNNNGVVVGTMSVSQGAESKDHGALSTDHNSGDKWNHHPLHHKNKLYYATYVALHAVISFFMLIATTGVIEIYYAIEGYNPHCGEPTDDHAAAALDDHASTVDDHYIGSDTESYHHYYHLKAQVVGGLVGVWCCMLLMELLQPEFYNSLVADWKTSKIVDQQYSKVMFALKIVVIFCHILLMAQSENPDKGNYFIFYNALIAAVPSLFDISKIMYDWWYDVSRKRQELAKTALEKQKLEEEIAKA